MEIWHLYICFMYSVEDGYSLKNRTDVFNTLSENIMDNDELTNTAAELLQYEDHARNTVARLTD